ncbi:transcription initiation factor TFIID subunit 9 [Phlebotomus argentipes]|uniref:transcription initiation factor TFIID subunit 9 n=1 Tax=Phlebotomus argentipes TaxID=94469 RepID=UPI0028936E0F|nr:transcription initiation factor TFIID subunit 9 [Phlebotomus argentipes]
MSSNKTINNVKHIPKDAQVIMSILKELGVTDYEPRVINQLLEFTYRYVTCILDDAKIYANHAKKKFIDPEDVKLASQMVLDKTFTSPPPRDVLLDLARSRNTAPLPLIKPHCGLRLPPDRYCLSSCNYKLKATAPTKKVTKPAIDARPNPPKPPGKLGASANSTIKRPQTITTVPKTQMVSIPKPVFKFSSAKQATKAKSGQQSIIISDEAAMIKVEDDDVLGMPTKRRRDDDDFEVVP